MTPESKISQIRRAWATGDFIIALKIAANFPKLGAEKEAITRAWAAHRNPQIYREMGQDPDKLIAAGLAAMEQKYGL